MSVNLSVVFKSRMMKELDMFSRSPPSGISCVAADNDRLDILSAQIIGATGTPYEGGLFQLEIQIPERYPFQPPSIHFLTPIYHPNIDSNGRICMDTLKLPPQGTWSPCLNISTVLMMIRVLMAEPGSEDPLMTDIWQEFKYDYTTYSKKAQQWTHEHATSSSLGKENMKSQSAESSNKLSDSKLDILSTNKEKSMEMTDQDKAQEKRKHNILTETGQNDHCSTLTETGQMDNCSKKLKLSRPKNE